MLPSTTTRRVPRLLLTLLPIALALALLAACGGAEDERVRRVAESAPPLGFADLAPVLRAEGPLGAAPERLSVSLAREVFPAAAVGERAPEGTRLELDPRLEGDLRVAAPDRLVFTPREPLEPGSTLAARLLALGLPEGRVLEGQEGSAPAAREEREVSREREDEDEDADAALRFVVPDFALRGASLAELEREQGRALVELAFTGPVAPAALEGLVTLRLEDAAGRALSAPRVRLEESPSAHVVRLPVSSGALGRARRLVVELDAGVVAAAGGSFVAPAAREEIALPEAPPARILDAYVAEGVNGHFIEVICDDDAVEQQRWYWDPLAGQSYGRLSMRCEPRAEDVAALVHLDPPRPFTVAPSGAGFRLFADLPRGPLRLRIDAGLRTVDGGRVVFPYESTLRVGPREPRLTLAESGRYLRPEALGRVALRHLNVREATLRLRHVPPENLVFWLSDRDEAVGEREGDLIVEKKVYLEGPVDEEVTTLLALDEALPDDLLGPLALEIESDQAVAGARLLLTDMHLVAKRGGVSEERPWGRAIRAWALDAASARGLRGVVIEAVRESGTVLGRCTTGTEGGCGIDLPEPGVDGSPPFALIARSEDELSYLAFGEAGIEIEEARVDGEPWVAPSPYSVALTSERGVYRPGEDVHLTALVRDQGRRAPVKSLPVSLVISDSRGRRVESRVLTLNGAGLDSATLRLADFAPTGRWRAEVRIAERPAGATSFLVEEFVPERIAVDVEPLAPDYLLDEPLAMRVDARYLFGGTPGGERVELTCTLVPSALDLPGLADYSFGALDAEGRALRPLPLGRASGTLDAEGRASLRCPDPAAAGGFRGPARVRARAAVFEAGSGRTSVGEGEARVHPARHYIGLKTSLAEARAGAALPVEGIVIERSGEPAPAALDEVTLELVRLESEYGWSYDEASGRYDVRRYLRPLLEAERRVPVENARFEARFELQADAEAYLVRARGGEELAADLRVEGRGRFFGWGDERSVLVETPRPETPALVPLDVPKRVRVGEDFTLRFEAPFAGRALVAIETERVLEHRFIDVEEGEVTWQTRLEAFVPNLYASVFVIRDPAEGVGTIAERAFGVASIDVDPEAFELELRVEAPEEVRSGATLEVALEVGRLEGEGFATVAVVDEGILSLTDFETPDPLALLFERRRLGVETFETIGYAIAPGPLDARAAVGGGLARAAAELGRITGIEPVALFSGVVPLDEQGRATVRFELPEYRGALRVMALSAGPRRAGSADARVVVRDPVVVEPTFPRFLARGDEVVVPVRVTNLSGEAREVVLAAEVEPVDTGQGAPAEAGVTLFAPERTTYELAHEESATLRLRLRADAAGGAARVVVRARSAAEVTSASGVVPLTSAAPRTRVHARVALEEGDNQLAAALPDFVPGTGRLTLRATASPYADVLGALEQLLVYPHGCLEQTVSRARPLLVLEELAPAIAPELLAEASVAERVQAGIERVLAMQQAEGAFSFWPGGGGGVHLFASAYALHFLLDARDAGYALPAERVELGLAALARLVADEPWQRASEGERVHTWRAREQAYALWVLARAGEPQSGRALRGLETLAPNRAQLEARALLAAALARAGERRYDELVRDLPTRALPAPHPADPSFSSPIRTRALLLETYVDLFGVDAGARQAADLLAEAMRGERRSWLSTQELGFGLSALAKTQPPGAATWAAPELRAEGLEIAPSQVLDDPRSFTWRIPRADEYERLVLTLPSKSGGEVFALLDAEGVREEAPALAPALSEGLALGRRFFDAEGRPLELGEETLTLGQLVVAEVSVANVGDVDLDNVALVVRLPAGLEVENPRLERGLALEWLRRDDAWSVEHLDVRDERVAAFGALRAGERRTIAMTLRATLAGRFLMPGPEAEAMYAPSLRGRGEGARVEVRGGGR